MDLERSRHAGGHVKCWERFAEASLGLNENIDLTVHFQGEREDVTALGPNTRIITLKPVFSSKRLFFLRSLADYTDLAPCHPRLKNRLKNYDVIHTTDGFFAYSRSAVRFAKRHNVPLVNSLHTNTPGFTKVYSERAIAHAFGDGLITRLLIERLCLPDLFSLRMEKKLTAHLGHCAAVFASIKDDLSAHVPSGIPVMPLRRGIDKTLFHPDKRDPQKLRSLYRIPDNRPIISYVGRLDGSKNVMTLAHAVRLLLNRGRDLHVVLAGKGYYLEAIKDLLGDHVSCAGSLDPAEVAHLNASTDLFVFPSTLEVWPNAVHEAKACGAPVIVAPGGGGIYITEPGRDGVVIADQAPEAWALEIDTLLGDADRRAALGVAARQDVETNRLSWGDVLRQDLIPVWRQAAA